MNDTITSLNFTQIFTEDFKSHISCFKSIRLEDLKVSLDKIDIKTNELCEKWIKKNLIQDSYFSSKQYKKSDLYKYNDNVCVKILRNNRNKNSKYNNKIEINPNHFENYAELKKFISNIIKGDTYLITRIDISFLFPSVSVSTRAFQLSCYVKHKEKHNVYANNIKEYNRSSISTISYGKAPHRLSIYDRRLKRSSPEDFINFEIQFSNNYVHKKLKVKTLDDLEMIYLRDPLQGIFFKNIMSNEKKKKLYSKMKERILHFRYKVSIEGLQIARSAYNTNHHNKFSRDIEPHFKNVKIAENLSLKKALIKVFKSDMKLYFKPDFKVYKLAS